MTNQERRQFRRTPLRFRISRLEGIGQIGQADPRTSDVSAGGMFFRAPLGQLPALGAPVSFELSVPPGEGYSAQGGLISGSGQVVRSLLDPSGVTGVAVRFTRPLSLSFHHPPRES